MAGPFIWNGNFAKSLKSFLNLNDVVYIINGTDDPTSVAKDAPKGSIYQRSGGSGGTVYTKQDAGSSTNWFQLGTTAVTLGITTKTTTYTATSGDSLIQVDATGGAFTVTLPDSAANGGLVLRFFKIDTGTNQVTITRAGADTIDGVNTKLLGTFRQSLTLVSDGGNTTWRTLENKVDTNWTSYTLNVTAATANPTKGGTITRDEARWRRVGDSMEIHWDYAQTAGGTAGTGQYFFSIPTGYTIDTAKISAVNAAAQGAVGPAIANDGTDDFVGTVMTRDSTTLWLRFSDETTGPTTVSSTFNQLSNTAQRYSFLATIPISGWDV